MAKSIAVKPKRGRPATGKDPLVGVRIPPDLISRIDQWSTSNGTSRSEAIRRLVEKALDGERTGPAPIAANLNENDYK